MPYLKRIHCPPPADDSAFPFSLSFLPSLHEREINSNVLFLVGENGSGKSSLLESIAIASRRISVGDSSLEQDPTLAEIRPLADKLRLGWSRRTGKGFFLRAEDFFNFVRRNKELEKTFDGYIEHFKDDARVRGYMEGNKRAINARYGRDLNDFSHGEGFLEFAKSRIHPGGLYLIDEPEAALSPQRQLAFALFVFELAQQGCQFIIASHSPIILSVPEAEIWSFDECGLETTTYAELEHVSFTKSFLQSPERYWNRLTDDD
ncbi:AAA family ATPase [Pelagicoccus sp. SDUM812002]|uniref:AAA family ATPase n=1 Tax=Pelagicoccus sp. SDUM812002 TaxID=3041266 RepID=UPI00280ED4A0|nr:AAA family ATPase [Pelagicoccus sp. SDUM812002]MDQ8184973.1 AAA family ATPase [Pelagicoccus sp. SDUM812002]